MVACQEAARVKREDGKQLTLHGHQMLGYVLHGRETLDSELEVGQAAVAMTLLYGPYRLGLVVSHIVLQFAQKRRRLVLPADGTDLRRRLSFAQIEIARERLATSTFSFPARSLWNRDLEHEIVRRSSMGHDGLRHQRIRPQPHGEQGTRNLAIE